MKRKLSFVMALMMLTLSLAGCNGSPAPAADGSPSANNGDELPHWTIGYSNRDDSDVYLRSVEENFKKLVDEDPTLDCLFADCANDSQLQLNQIDNFLVQGADALVLVPQDSATVVDIIEQCNADDMPVFCSSLSADGGEYCFVGASDYMMGHIQGTFAHDNLPENSKILYIGGNLGYQVSVDRRQALVDGLGERLYADWDGNVLNPEGDIQILGWQYTMGTMDEGMQVMEDYIQTYDDFNCVITFSDSTALGALEAMKGAGITDCTVISIDGLPDALNAVKEGKITLTVMQSAERHAKSLYDGIKLAQAGKELPEKIEPELIVVDGGNVDDHLS